MNWLFTIIAKTLSGVSSAQWGKILSVVVNAARTFKENEDKATWAKAEIKDLAKDWNVTLSAGAINFLVEFAVRVLKYTKVLPL